MNTQNVFNTDIFVSVIIPTFNRKAALQATIQSVLKQNAPPSLEIIVVDDCSTDGTDKLDFLSLDPRIRLIRHSENKGGSAARNTGMANANGNWFAFLDSDDVWLPHRLEHQIDLIYSSANVLNRFFITGNVIARIPNRKDVPFNSRPPYTGENLSEYFLVHDCTFQTSSLLIPAQAFLEVCFDESLKKHQDTDFILKLIQTGYQYIYCHEQVAVYNLANDPDRISIKFQSAEITLEWLHRSKELTTSAARSYYYTYRRFPSHFRHQPCAAFQSLLRLALEDTRSFKYTLLAIKRLFAEKIKLRD
jgi:glycosyltransferase involved in cell wall biosynthesis